mmetsp:Transcript_12512/g.44290  ORF Transcript_12512/g.44290 Transcript_12512/m.44290 type:complete len:315 (-) Transcript_12512:1408-2352(-)
MLEGLHARERPHRGSRPLQAACLAHAARTLRGVPAVGGRQQCRGGRGRGSGAGEVGAKAQCRSDETGGRGAACRRSRGCREQEGNDHGCGEEDQWSHRLQGLDAGCQGLECGSARFLRALHLHSGSRVAVLGERVACVLDQHLAEGRGRYRCLRQSGSSDSLCIIGRFLGGLSVCPRMLVRLLLLEVFQNSAQRNVEDDVAADNGLVRYHTRGSCAESVWQRRYADGHHVADVVPDVVFALLPRTYRHHCGRHHGSARTAVVGYSAGDHEGHLPVLRSHRSGGDPRSNDGSLAIARRAVQLLRCIGLHSVLRPC